MKVISVFVVFLFGLQGIFAQNIDWNFKNKRKGKFYFYWGYNNFVYSTINISLKGDRYDFGLKNVKVTDKQAPFDKSVYFLITKFTIHQYNYQMGYSFSDSWNVSIGLDYMKYIVNQGQNVGIEEQINYKLHSKYWGLYGENDTKN